MPHGRVLLLAAFAVQIPIFDVISDGSFKSLILPSVAMAVPIICIATRVLPVSYTHLVVYKRQVHIRPDL